MKCAGFLVVEVALVLALILVIITLATPQFLFLKRQMVHSEIQKLIAEFFYHRAYAMATHQDLMLTVDPGRGTYGTQERMLSLASGVQFGFLPQLLGPPSQPTRLIDKAVSFLHNRINFYADGTMSSGTIYLLDSQNRRCYAVTIPAGQAPFIRSYEYQDRWVLIS